MNVFDELDRFFRPLAPRHLLVAVSGGSDSTALLHALTELPGRSFALTAAHVNHKLRAEASVLDEAFVRETCSALGIPLLVRNGPLQADAIRHSGIEGAARTLRYELLQQCRAEAGADYLATAHHRDDQAETVLMKFMTGAGIARLRGIAPVTSAGLVRPLLRVPRSDLAAFLAERGIAARHDEMNSDRRFLRSRVRFEILPLLRSINPAIDAALAATAAEARHASELLERRVAEAFIADRQADRTIVSRAQLAGDRHLAASFLLSEIRRLEPSARGISRADLERILDSLENTPRMTLSDRLELFAFPDVIEVRRRSAVTPSFEVEIRADSEVPIDVIRTTFRLMQKSGPPPPLLGDESRQFFHLPAGTEPVFRIRNRRKGDRFFPLGAPGEKKLSHFLIDRKIEAERRDRIPLLLCGSEIVWVAGIAVSERFKVSEGERTLYEISIVDEQKEGHE